MGLFGSVLSVAVLMLLVHPVNSAKEHVFFSDYTQCDETYTVGRDHVVEIAPKRPSSGASSAFTDCKLLFRAGALDDKICVKIHALTFSNNKLELQYFDSLDPVDGTTPTKSYNRSSYYGPPIEICSNVYGLTLKLHSLEADANINDIDALITVFNMQGTQRIAYFDEDCGTTFKLRDSTVSVQTINAAGSNPKVAVCLLYLEYIGTNPSKTVCYQYQSLRADECDYTMNVLDGGPASFRYIHTYTCATTSPQTYCTTEKTLTFELFNKGASGLPDNTFTITVKDGTKEKGLQQLEPGGKVDLPHQIADILHKAKPQKPNITRSNKQAIKQLREDPDIVIAPSDKERAAVVIDSDHFHFKVEDMLQDESTYKLMKKDPTTKLERKHDDIEQGSYDVTSLVGAVVGTILVVALLGVGTHICLIRQGRLQWIKDLEAC